jgi:hypothetical protein
MTSRECPLAEHAASLPPRVADLGMSDEAIRRGSGKSWDEWFALLDAWGAIGRTHAEIARYLAEAHRVSGWWTQTVTVGHERARGMRKINETTKGCSGSASKTLPVPVARLYAAFVEGTARDRWLEPGVLTLRTAQAHRSARSDVAETVGGGILELWFTEKAPAKSSVQIMQGKLADDAALEKWRQYWKAQLRHLVTSVT